MVFLVFVMLIGAALELLGVGLIYQAAGVITDPDILENNDVRPLHKINHHSPGCGKLVAVYKLEL